MPFVGVDIGPTDGRHRHLDQNFAGPSGAYRKLLEDKWRIGRFVNGGLCGAHAIFLSIVGGWIVLLDYFVLMMIAGLFDAVEREIEYVVVA